MNRQSLKIAVVRPYLTVKKGGAERYALELIRGLSGAGHEVHAYAFQWDEPAQPGATYVRVPMPRKPAWLRVLLFHWHLRRRLRLDDYDAVLGLTPFWPQTICWLGDGLYRVWVRIAWPAALVRWVMCLKRTVMAVNLRLEKRMLTSPTAAFIANSHLVARQARKLYGVPKDRIRVIYPWIDAERFNPAARERWRDATRRSLAIGDDPFVWLFAANNFQRKGLDLVLRALAGIDRGQTPLRLIVVGAGKIAHYRRKAGRLGLAAEVAFVGAVNDIERYYAAADAFILPTLYDPCAAVCLEAMACGLPVITTNMNGAAEFIDDGKNGRIIAADASAESLAQTILSLSDRERCADAAAQACERVRPLTGAAHLRQWFDALSAFAPSGDRPIPVRLHPTLIVNKIFAPLLARHGLTDCSALAEAPGRIEFDYNQNKRMWLLKLDDHGGSRQLYLKARRRRRSWIDGLRRFFLLPGKTAGAREWENLLEFQCAGLRTAAPVVMGERRLVDGSVESLVATLGLDEYKSLDDYIATRLAPPYSAAILNERRRMIAAVAQLARRMHGMGFHHRDFYLCHIFAKAGAPDVADLRMIDLERAGRRRFLFHRWRIKDLAQLHYSSLGLPISDYDRLRFFAVYSPNRRRWRRRWLRQVLRKSRAIARHDARLRARRSGPVAKNGFESDPNLAKISSGHD